LAYSRFQVWIGVGTIFFEDMLRILILAIKYLNPSVISHAWQQKLRLSKCSRKAPQPFYEQISNTVLSIFYKLGSRNWNCKALIKSLALA
jgi:hypothetical protein